jgi:hypothetical protein
MNLRAIASMRHLGVLPKLWKIDREEETYSQTSANLAGAAAPASPNVATPLGDGQHYFSPSILPKASCDSITNDALRKPSVIAIWSHYVFPPEGANFPCCMWNFVLVIFEPDQLNLGNVHFIVKFCEGVWAVGHHSTILDWSRPDPLSLLILELFPRLLNFLPFSFVCCLFTSIVFLFCQYFLLLLGIPDCAHGIGCDWGNCSI